MMPFSGQVRELGAGGYRHVHLLRAMVVRCVRRERARERERARASPWHLQTNKQKCRQARCGERTSTAVGRWHPLDGNATLRDDVAMWALDDTKWLVGILSSTGLGFCCEFDSSLGVGTKGDVGGFPATALASSFLFSFSKLAAADALDLRSVCMCENIVTGALRSIIGT